MMNWITDLDSLHAHYGTPSRPALAKVTRHMTPAYAAFLERARFCILSTVGPEGTDGSPRGDLGPVVTVADAETLLLPDWQGNQRIDSLRNILRDGRVSPPRRRNMRSSCRHIGACTWAMAMVSIPLADLRLFTPRAANHRC